MPRISVNEKLELIEAALLGPRHRFMRQERAELTRKFIGKIDLLTLISEAALARVWASGDEDHVANSIERLIEVLDGYLETDSEDADVQQAVHENP